MSSSDSFQLPDLRGMFLVRSDVAVRSEAKEKKMSDKDEYSGMTQYRKIGNMLAPCQGTVGVIPPGIYTMGVVEQGTIVFSPHKMMTDDLIRFEDQVSDSIIKDIEHFWTQRSQYDKYGLTFKRGFLMHGPQGSGKTAVVALVMKEMVAKGGVVILNSSVDLVVAGLRMLRAIEPNRAVMVVWEDGENVLERSGHAALALLDGEMQVDNVVYIATTNYPELMAKRLTNRPSRFDRVVAIGMPSASARRKYMESRLKDAMDPATLTEWTQKTNGLSFAHLKELIISVHCFGLKFDDALAKIKAMAAELDSKNQDQYRELN